MHVKQHKVVDFTKSDQPTKLWNTLDKMIEEPYNFKLH